MQEFGPHKEHGESQGNFGGMVPVPENDGMRMRRECIEWINDQHGRVLDEHTTTAREIMEHCFGVAAKLLGKE
jgi:hypothetical protein